jgi:hypothetical protein
LFTHIKVAEIFIEIVADELKVKKLVVINRVPYFNFSNFITGLAGDGKTKAGRFSWQLAEVPDDVVVAWQFVSKQG